MNDDPRQGASSAEFDENYYLRTNPDVAEGVRRGGWISGYEHYIRHGKDEGRPGIPPKSSSRFDLGQAASKHRDQRYLVPSDLTVTPVSIRRIALVGSCMLEGWHSYLKGISPCEIDLIVTGDAPPPPPMIVNNANGKCKIAYDFQIIQIALRSILYDDLIVRLSLNDEDANKKIFEDVCDKMRVILNGLMKYNNDYGIPSFVCNFMVPQKNPIGSLFPKYKLSNQEYFIYKLNQALEEETRQYGNAFILDIDRVSASVGRRYVQDDSVTVTTHGSMVPNTPEITSRIEVMPAFSHHYEIKPADVFIDSVFAEAVGMYRALLQIDTVKMVVVDLDDTLWNGISGDMTDIDSFMVEGWPIGLAEALLYLKKRGILLSIISKNEESRIRKIWHDIFKKRLSLSDFAAVKINWRPKAENMREILNDVNILPRSVVFIDDNPAERDAMALAFPEMRILGRYPYYLRRTLLWSAETQVVAVSTESERRTEMIQAQLQRESSRKSLTREEFLKLAAPKIKFFCIKSGEHARFSRAFELLNKTNQFNTTGKRWKIEEFPSFFSEGGVVYSFDVTDNYTGYGLVGVVLCKDKTIEQWAMSCRVLGLGVEAAVMAILARSMRAQTVAPIVGLLRHTEVNFPCRTLFSDAGFRLEGDVWILPPTVELSVPDHITIEHS